MGKIVVLIGPTGAGKSVQGDRLAKSYGWVHLSSGELLRQSELEAEILQSGGLATEEVVETVIEESVIAVDINTTIVLDGFPRTLEQAKWLESAALAWGREVTAVVRLVVGQETSWARLENRGRGDDTLESRLRKWREYELRTQPVESYYQQEGLLRTIDAEGTREDVYERIKAVLG